MTCYERLKKEKDFALVIKKGKRVFSDKVTLYYIEADSSLVGFAVSKKHGGSVKRNRIKRILRESFRSFAPQIRQNFFFVFIPKISEEYNFNEIKSSIYYVLKKGKFFNE
jgi:ribonuclease P protein component